MFMGNENLFERDFIPTLSELLVDTICFGDTDGFYFVFELMEPEEIESHLEWFISAAIEKERPEFTVFLLDYKKNHNLYTPPNWNI